MTTSNKEQNHPALSPSLAEFESIIINNNNKSNNNSLCCDITLDPLPSAIGSNSRWSNSSCSSSIICNGAVLHVPSNTIYGLSTSSPPKTAWHYRSSNGTLNGLVSSSSSSSDLLICSSTTNGDISLLEGSTGTVLVTRRVATSFVHMGFVVNDNNNNNNNNNNTHALFLMTDKKQQIMLVYNVQKEDISCIKFASLKLSCDDSMIIKQIRAHQITTTIIQFIVLTDQGQISIYKYDIATELTTPTSCDALLLLKEEERCCCNVGLSSYYNNFLSFLITTTPTTTTNTKTVSDDATEYNYLQWLHLPSLTKSDKFNVSRCLTSKQPTSSTNNNNSNTKEQVLIKVLTMEPVSTFHSNEAIGAAIATVQVTQQQQLSLLKQDYSTSNNNQKNFGVYIVQLLVVENSNDKQLLLANLHVVFYIPLDYYYYSTATIKLRLASCSLVACHNNAKPYSIRMALIYGNTTTTNTTISNTKSTIVMKCMSFLDDDDDGDTTISSSITVGKFHSLIARQMYQEADTLYLQQHQLSEQHQQWMHPSHVTLAQLSSLLLVSSNGDDNNEEIFESLMRLKTAVIAEKSNGVATTCFVHAVKLLLVVSSSSNSFFLQKKHRIIASIHALSEICTTKRNIMLYKSLKKKLETQLAVITIASQVLATNEEEDDDDMMLVLASVETTSHLFTMLVSCQKYEKAEHVRGLAARSTTTATSSSSISKETIAFAIMNNNHSSLFSHFVIYWISNCIVPHIAGIYDPLWKQICLWSSTVDNSYYDEVAIISILECICEATSLMETTSYLSTFFNKQVLCNNNHSNNNTLSFQNSSSSSSSTFESTNNIINASNTYYDDVYPTVFEISSKKKFARRVILTPKDDNDDTTATAAENDSSSNNIELCREKLCQARLLRDAKALGLPCSCLSLINFEELGGSFYVVVELLRWYLATTTTAMSVDHASNVIRGKIQPFCTSHNIRNLDEILEFYARDRLAALSTHTNGDDDNDEKQDLPSVMSIFNEISYISYCTETIETRGRIVLQLLRSGLLFSVELATTNHQGEDAVNLELLSSNVAQELLPINPLLSSELKEASRLLQIDAILCQYCGCEARNWFRVNYPDHMRSLIRHVCLFMDQPNVLDHVCTLCDASLTSSDKVEAVTDILRRIMFAQESSQPSMDNSHHHDMNKEQRNNCRSQQCGEMIRLLLGKDADFAAKVATNVLRFAVHTIEECSIQCCGQVIELREEENLDTLRAKARAACVASLSIASVLKEVGVDSLQARTTEVALGYCSSTWIKIWSDFRRLQLLQTQYSLYLSISDLQDRRHQPDTMPQLLQSAIDMINERHTQTPRKCWDNFEDNFSNDDDWVVQLKSRLTRARRGCTLLCNSESESYATWWEAIASAACNLLHTSGDVACFLILRSSGVLEENVSATSLVASESTSVALLSVAEALFSSASNAVAAIRQTKSSRISMLGYADSESDSESEPSAGPVDSHVQDSSLFKSMLHIVRSSFLIQHYCMVNSPCDKFPAVVATARLVDLLSQTLLRTDAGFGEALEVKLQSIYANTLKLSQDSLPAPSVKMLSFLPSLPVLHPTWYVGDGLLLPPQDSLILSLDHWKDRDGNHFANAAKTACGDIFSNEPWSAHGDMFSLLNSRGAHTLALRLLTLYSFGFAPSAHPQSVSDTTVESHVRDKLQTLYQGTIRYLTERSLGGAGAGITSGAIDSNLSVAHLLCLPRQLAFKLYRASLPSAINRRDFERVMTLSAIGMYAAGGGMSSLPSNVGWTNQRTFLTQCQKLASCAYWWNILKTYRVEFDPGMFEQNKGEKFASYASSLLPYLIEHVSHAGIQPTTILKISVQYCNAFATDQTIAATKVVEFYLACPATASERISSAQKNLDARFDLGLCKEGARIALLFLSVSNRIKVLRGCLINLEKEGDRSGTDYERYNLILSIYRQELISLLQTNNENVNSESLQYEFEFVNRRIEVLALLSSFFGGSKEVPQNPIPSYPDFFLPLVNFNKPLTGQKKLCSVLGKLGSDAQKSDVFDPLAPLQPFLSTHFGQIAANALAPICHLLGLPGGYLQARQLCERFVTASEKDLPMPSFDDNVLPVLHRLKFSKDCTELAEWCSSQYTYDDKERLVCLKDAHLYAVKFSNEAESRLQYEKSDININEAKIALEAVKRIGKKMMALGDFVLVKEVLFNSSTNLSSAAKKILTSVINVVRSKTNDSTPPELLVELLIDESSSLTADASLEKFQDFSMHDFRQVASRIHEACLRIANEHSHVNPRAVVFSFSRRWLIHGDSAMVKAIDKESKQTVLKPRNDDALIEDDDTKDFVMDLSSFGHGRDMWADDIGFSEQSTFDMISVGEEPYGLKAKGSAREQIEYENARACLRIAFILSFAHNYVDLLNSKSSPVETYDDPSKESRQSNDKSVSSLTLAFGGTKKRHNDGTEYARQLLHVVFMDLKSKETHQSPGDSFLKDTKTITFAMRHRALRSALILCPDQVLRSIIKEKEYFSELVDGEALFAHHLERCKIASYVAMEIEDMGLPLPHSDLAQLSSMHFSSYARALWRHHGESGDSIAFRGRLLGLLIELCTVQGQQIDDTPLVVNVMNEIMKHRKLPRTALSAIERIINCESVASRIQAIRNVDAVVHHDGEKVIARSLITTAQALLDELKQSLNKDSAGQQALLIDDNECYDVLRRITKAALILHSLGVKRINLFMFTSELCNAISLLSSLKPALARRISSLALESAQRVSLEEGRTALLSKIRDSEIAMKKQQKS